MKTEQYNAMLGWFRARPAARRALRIASTGAVVAVYVLYAGLLSWLLWQSSPLLPGEVLVPAIKECIRKVDVAEGKMIVHLMDGLVQE